MSQNAIIALTMQALSNDGHFQMHSEIAKLIAEITAAALHVPDLAPIHAARLADLDVVLKGIPKSPLTEQLHAADKARDETYRGLVFALKSACLHFTPLTRAAARRVMIVVKTYGNVARKSYEEESSAVYNLVQDLKSAKYATDVGTAGLTQWVTTLEIQNNQFMATLDSRDNEYAAKSHVAVRDARHAVDEAYGNIIMRVSSHIGGGDHSPETALFVNKLNVIIKRFKTLIHHRGGHEHAHHDNNADGQDAGEGGTQT